MVVICPRLVSLLISEVILIEVNSMFLLFLGSPFCFATVRLLGSRGIGLILFFHVQMCRFLNCACQSGWKKSNQICFQVWFFFGPSIQVSFVCIKTNYMPNGSQLLCVCGNWRNLIRRPDLRFKVGSGQGETLPTGQIHICTRTDLIHSNFHCRSNGQAVKYIVLVEIKKNTLKTPWLCVSNLQ